MEWPETERLERRQGEPGSSTPPFSQSPAQVSLRGPSLNLPSCPSAAKSAKPVHRLSGSLAQSLETSFSARVWQGSRRKSKATNPLWEFIHLNLREAGMDFCERSDPRASATRLGPPPRASENVTSYKVQWEVLLCSKKLGPRKEELTCGAHKLEAGDSLLSR